MRAKTYTKKDVVKRTAKRLGKKIYETEDIVRPERVRVPGDPVIEDLRRQAGTGKVLFVKIIGEFLLLDGSTGQVDLQDLSHVSLCHVSPPSPSDSLLLPSQVPGSPAITKLEIKVPKIVTANLFVPFSPGHGADS